MAEGLIKVFESQAMILEASRAGRQRARRSAALPLAHDAFLPFFANIASPTPPG
jgi:hypothetical protein